MPYPRAFFSVYTPLAFGSDKQIAICPFAMKTCHTERFGAIFRQICKYRSHIVDSFETGPCTLYRRQRDERVLMQEPAAMRLCALPVNPLAGVDGRDSQSQDICSPRLWAGSGSQEPVALRLFARRVHSSWC